MKYPMVGERVWVHDCPHAFVVVCIDYTGLMATLAPVPSNLVRASNGLAASSRNRTLRENVPLASLMVDPMSAPQSADREKTLSLICSSWQRIVAGRHLVADLRESIATTMAAIHQSSSLLAESDHLIERSRTLDRDVKLP